MTVTIRGTATDPTGATHRGRIILTTNQLRIIDQRGQTTITTPITTVTRIDRRTWHATTNDGIWIIHSEGCRCRH